MRLILDSIRNLAIVSLLTIACHAQIPAIGANSSSPGSPESQSAPQREIPTFKSSARLVSVEIVARDHQGQPVHGLTAADFQVSEQVAPKRNQHPQKISAFRAMNVQEIAAQGVGRPNPPPGVYTNLMTMNNVPVPPTILLVDGLNTDLSSQIQVHQQMVRMLASIPDNVPTAVFLLGNRLRMIQNFTTDPKLLKSALKSASSVAFDKATQLDPRDDPDALSALIGDFATNSSAQTQATIDVLKRFDQETFASQLDIRVQETLDALRGIARHVTGYPGRKNLLWISSSFPIMFTPDPDAEFLAQRDYGGQVAAVANALADAKVAVYPVDPSGVGGASVFGGSTSVMRDSGTLNRDQMSLLNRQESMQSLAEQTGGRVCVNDNDLGDCVKKAMDDSSFFYEITYYPNSGNWHGEFHKITVKSVRPGIQLVYRQGYYASGPAEETNPKSATEELERSACLDVLTSTSLPMATKSLPEPGLLKYFVVVEPSTITFTPESDGTQHVALKVAMCTFDKSGHPLRFWQDTIDEKLTDKQYAEVLAKARFGRVVSIVPTPGVALVRVLIKDMTTGKTGSVNIPNAETAAAATAPPANTLGTSLPH